MLFRLYLATHSSAACLRADAWLKVWINGLPVSFLLYQKLICSCKSKRTLVDWLFSSKSKLCNCLFTTVGLRAHQHVVLRLVNAAGFRTACNPFFCRIFVTTSLWLAWGLCSFDSLAFQDVAFIGSVTTTCF